MMAPLPNPTPPPDRPDLPRVRLEVRTGSGRTVSYEVGTTEFLVGGAGGCDLRLPAPNLPPVVCQLTRKPDGVRVRRLAPGLPVLLNGSPLPSNTATAVSDTDVLSVAGVEIVVAIRLTSFVSPKLIPIEPAPAAAPPPPPAADAPTREAELDRRQRELDQRTE